MFESIVFIIHRYVTMTPKQRGFKIAVFTGSQCYGSGIQTGILCMILVTQHRLGLVTQ